ncbi:MAG: transporter substrate-binding domain-containing protein [Spirochaetaceae bacterium]|nr:transporter substrate-binding domain-containing protein [Spirochaetaceae bacterium]
MKKLQQKKAVKTAWSFGTVVMAGLIILAGSTVIFSCSKKEAPNVSSGDESGKLIVVGTGKAYEPYCYMDANGNLVGYEKAVLDEVDKRLPQYHFTYDIYDFQNVLVSLAAGKIDIGAHEFESNPKRRETYLYGEEGYNDYNNWLMVKADGPWKDISGIKDLYGNPKAILGVTAGSNREAFLKLWNEDHGANEKVAFEIFNDNEIVYRNIISGHLAGTFTILNEMLRANALIDGLNLISRGDKPVTESQAYFLFQKGNTELQSAVDGALRAMKSDGTLERIRNKEVIQYYENLGKK